MKISIRYATQIRLTAGAQAETLEMAESSSVRDLFEQICQSHGDDLRTSLLDDTGSVRRSLIVCLNNKHILDVDDQQLADGDEVLIMSAISGG